MNQLGLKLKTFSPAGNALLWLGISSVIMGALFLLVPPEEMRPGAGVFLVLVVVGITASAYWARQREVAGLPPFFFAKQNPHFAALAAFLLVGAFSALFAWFTDPEKNALLYGAFMGTALGALTYQHRRTGKDSFPALLATFVPLTVVYLLITAYMKAS